MCKRKVEIIQAHKNRGEKFNIAEIDASLLNEYKEYMRQLSEKQKEIDAASFWKNAHSELSTEESAEIKKLYTAIVKKLHPDINHNITIEQHQAFIRAVDAYKAGDAAELRVIYLLLEKTLDSTAAAPDLKERLQKKETMLVYEKTRLQMEIDKIINTFPYTAQKLLENKTLLFEAIEKHKKTFSSLQMLYTNTEEKLKELLNE